MRLEIDKLQAGQADLENISESGSVTNDSVDLGDRPTDSTLIKSLSNGADGPHNSKVKLNFHDEKGTPRNGTNPLGNLDFHANDVSTTLFCHDVSTTLVLIHLCLWYFLASSTVPDFKDV